MQRENKSLLEQIAEVRRQLARASSATEAAATKERDAADAKLRAASESAEARQAEALEALRQEHAQQFAAAEEHMRDMEQRAGELQEQWAAKLRIGMRQADDKLAEAREQWGRERLELEHRLLEDTDAAQAEQTIAQLRIDVEKSQAELVEVRTKSERDRAELEQALAATHASAMKLVDRAVSPVAPLQPDDSGAEAAGGEEESGRKLERWDSTKALINAEPPSAPPDDGDAAFTATFVEPGPLGLQLEAEEEDSDAVVARITAGSLASSQQGLRRFFGEDGERLEQEERGQNVVLTKVAGEDVTGKRLEDEIIPALLQASRPLSLGFALRPAEPAAPAPAETESQHSDAPGAGEDPTLFDASSASAASIAEERHWDPEDEEYARSLARWVVPRGLNPRAAGDDRTIK